MKGLISNLKTRVLGAFLLLGLFTNNAMAAITSTDVDPIKTDVLTSVGIAAAGALAIMAVVLGWDVGISLIKKFIKKGAS